VSVPPRLQDQVVIQVQRVQQVQQVQRVQAISRGVIALLVSGTVAAMSTFVATRAQTGPAFFIRSLENPSERREQRSDILDTPILPGSVIKAVTLVAALESQVIEPDTARLCRRVVTVDGRRYVCAHPDLKRAMTPAEALAHSCNDFFVSLAPRLSRSALNDVRLRLGLPPVAESTNFAAALVGLDGPRVTPRALLDTISRLAGADPQRRIAVSETARRVLTDGLRGAAQYGSASAFSARQLSALAKTGTAPMPGGSWMGIVVALMPAHQPTHGMVVVAPGAGGTDAAGIAADLFASTAASDRSSSAIASSTGVVEPIRVGTLTANGSARVTAFHVEDYVARVLAGEGQPRAADAAQQALAITVRTFALANRNRHRREGYDLCDTTHCQVVRPATEVTRRAAQATAGRVLVHQGQPASVFYSAWCGGRSELASEVWPGAVDYSIAPQKDEACDEEPDWVSELRAEELERALRAAGLRGDRLRALRILDRNPSGRVARLRADGFTPNEVSAHDFRMAVGRVVGWQKLKSTAFDLRRNGSGYQFTGTGFGHGVGLCVIGAGHRAAVGASAEDILRFYFPTLRVEQFRPAASLTSAPKPPDVKTAPDPDRADVLVALPASEERERSWVVNAVRTARDDIAVTAGVAPPPVIRITVHPTVESFGRTTGQPWWVSGATEGANIDLLPMTILRQRGQLERTIRHEVAHVLIDGTLTRRPMWVREGAAFYFADSSGEAEPIGRRTCPADDEFLRPMSAGLHRSAYARAEACFRRAIAAGKPWQEVR